MKEGRHIGSLIGPKHTKWKKPIARKTAVELLYRADDGEIRLSDSQREHLVERAGKDYKSNPLDMRKGEDTESFMARLKRRFG